MDHTADSASGAPLHHPLNRFKRFSLNDSFMHIFYNDPLRFWNPNRLFRLVTYLFMLSLHHISDINLIMQYLIYGGTAPKSCICILQCTAVMDAMQLLIGRWTWNFFIIQDACDLVCTDSVKSHGEDPSYHFGCFRVDDEFSFCIWVFAVSIPCKRADEQSLFPLVVKHRADIGGQIFQIPFVDQAVDLARFFVRGIVGIHMVYHRNEADSPLHELSVQIFFHEFHVTGKTGLRFGQYHIKLMFACGLQHRIERRTVPVDAGIILIRIDLVNIKSFLNGVLEQHRLLILNALRFANFIFIFFAQAAINCCFHDFPPSFCTRASMRSITHLSFKFRDATSGAGS